MKRSTIIELACAVFILLFVYTGTTKLMGRQTFAINLEQSPLLAGYATIISWLLPIAELVIAVLLFLPPTRKAGLYAFVVLLVIFSGYIVYMLVYAPRLPCSCGGVVGFLTWRQHLLLNGLLIVVGSTGLLQYKKIKGRKLKTFIKE